MNIIFVSPFGLGQKTTVWARTLPLARRLVERGCQVTVLIPPWDTPADSGRCWVDAGVRVENVSLAGGLPLVTARLLARVRALKPEIVHVVKPRAHAGIVQWILWQWRRLSGRGPRLILDVDDWEQAWSAIGGYSRLTARFLDWQERWGITHADGVTAASCWLLETVGAGRPQMPILYLPNGIAAPPTSLRADDRPTGAHPSLLLFSRFVEVEPAWMGEFWREIQRLRPGVRLVVAGKALQPHREDAFRQALAGDTSPVQWAGYVDKAQLADLYATATCAIFPAADVPLNQAKCSVRLATTLLNGVPVVASAVGEQAHYGGHGAAKLVPAGATPAAFAVAVGELLADPAARQDQIVTARWRLLDEYDWARLGDALFDFYRNPPTDPARTAEK
ncbi:MAG: glycosyltransferase family 4 protein [Caldilineaceae bacterium]